MKDYHTVWLAANKEIFYRRLGLRISLTTGLLTEVLFLMNMERWHHFSVVCNEPPRLQTQSG